MGLNDLSHMRFQSKFQSSCLPLHFTHGRLSNTSCGLLSNWVFTQKPTQQMGMPNKVAVLRATIDGSLSHCNIALRYPGRRNKDTNHDVAYSLLSLSLTQIAAYAPVFTSFATKMSSLFSVVSSSSSSSLPSFDAGRVQTEHGVRLQAWLVHVRTQQHWVAELQSLHHQCLHPKSRFQRA